MRQVTDWIFDLDNTLYAHDQGLWNAIDAKILSFVEQCLNLDAERARELQKQYFFEYGSTLGGLVRKHQTDPLEFLAHVHDVDYSALSRNWALDEALSGLPGRKFIYTNASENHVRLVLERLGIERHFDDCFDIIAADIKPKPSRLAFDAMMARFKIVDAERAMFFDDLAQNLRPAAEARVSTVLVEPALGRPSCCDGSSSTQEDTVRLESIETKDYEEYVDYRTSDLAGFLKNYRRKLRSVET